MFDTMTRLLLHIGFPKAGSTYLQKWFSEHPAFYYKSKAIAGFYNAHDIARYAYNDGEIHECFVVSSEDLSIWKGDIDIVGFEGKPYDTVAYHKKLSLTLSRIFPNAKMLIVTRGYDSMFKSLYSQYIKGGGILTFSELQKKFGSYFPAIYDYSFVISLYRDVMGSENVIVLPYELLRDDPSKFTSLIEQCVGINKHFEFSTEKVNPAVSGQLLTAYRKLSKFLYQIIRPFPYEIKKTLFLYHVKQYITKDNLSLINLISKLCTEEKPIQVEDWLLESMKGKADLLKHEKLFQPYLQEYLI